MDKTDLKKTALYEEHAALGAKMIPFGDYIMPGWYSSIISEQIACRNNVVIFDINHMGRIEIAGEDRNRFTNRATSNDIRKLDINQAQYSLILNVDGTIIDDCIVYLFADKVLLIVNSGKDELVVNHFKKIKGDLSVDINNISDSTGLLAVQGPDSEKVYHILFDEKFEELPYFHYKQLAWKGNEIIVSRTGYTGSPGFELMFSNNINKELWNTIMTIGDDFKIKPAGLGARDMLRLEMGYPLWGNELDGHTPIEARLNWVVIFDKESFNGRVALVKTKENPPDEVLTGVIMESRIVPRKGTLIFSTENEQIGQITSGGFSPILNKGIGLAYIAKDHSKSGTEVLLKIRDKNHLGKTKKPPLISSQVK